MGEIVEGLLELPRGEGVAARGEEATERGAGDRVYEEAGAALTGDLLERVRAGPRAGCGAGVRQVKDDAAADHANVLLDPARVVGVMAAVNAEHVEAGVVCDSPRDGRPDTGRRAHDDRPLIVVRHTHTSSWRRRCRARSSRA